jgi:TrmH family RNA methyltransferase
MSARFRKYHKAFAHSYAFGVYSTLELLTRAPELALHVLLRNDRGGSGVGRICTLCRERGVPLSIAPRAIERIGGGSAPAVGVFTKRPQPVRPEANHVVLVAPKTAGNVGTIIRTMIAFGLADMVIIRPATDILAPAAVRAAMGATFQLRWQYYDSLGAYRSQGDRRLYCFTPAGHVPLDVLEVRPPFSLVFGSEGEGLSEELLRLGTGVRIPQTAGVDSLNLAASAAIALYHVAACGK